MKVQVNKNSNAVCLEYIEIIVFECDWNDLRIS